jgi:hypothetical protein
VQRKCVCGRVRKLELTVFFFRCDIFVTVEAHAVVKDTCNNRIVLCTLELVLRCNY